MISINQLEAEQASLFRVDAREQGTVIHLADSLIAGTAKVHNLTLITHNVDDFSGMDIHLVNPWKK